MAGEGEKTGKGNPGFGMSLHIGHAQRIWTGLAEGTRIGANDVRIVKQMSTGRERMRVKMWNTDRVCVTGRESKRHTLSVNVRVREPAAAKSSISPTCEGEAEVEDQPFAMRRTPK